MRPLGIALLVGIAASGGVPSAETAEETGIDVAVILIKDRQFQPDRTLVHRGRKAKLIVHNHDAELHTFAPLELFAKESFTLGGNGAPEFGPSGFKRVIIPPDGRAELEFTPSQSGEYRYTCDMPGHRMSAVIVVE